MELKQLIEEGWARHERETEALASDLERHADLVDEPGKAGAFAALATHAIGDHLGDWSRAERLVATVLAPLPEGPLLAGPLASLAVARFLAGRPADALATEMRAVALAERGPMAALLHTRMILASALVAARRVPEATAIYEAAADVAEAETEGRPWDRTVAITSNNLASALLEREDRTAEEGRLMLRSAETARTFWLRAGNWVNDERADYLLSGVHAALGDAARALEHADRALATIRKNGEEPVDEAFLELSRVRSLEALGRADDAREALERADGLAKAFPDEGLTSWFAKERAKVTSAASA